MSQDPVVEASRRILVSGAEVVGGLSVAEMTQRHGAIVEGSIGGHFRHVLDHFRLLLEGGAVVDYDARDRGTSIEEDPAEAAHEAGRLVAMLADVENPDRPVTIRTRVGAPGEPVALCGSTLRRELMFCISHAIHHYALISVLLRLEGREVAANFGVAPATVEYRATSAR